jgi:hypothetical protein
VLRKRERGQGSVSERSLGGQEDTATRDVDVVVMNAAVAAGVVAAKIFLLASAEGSRARPRGSKSSSAIRCSQKPKLTVHGNK